MFFRWSSHRRTWARTRFIEQYFPAEQLVRRKVIQTWASSERLEEYPSEDWNQRAVSDEIRCVELVFQNPHIATIEVFFRSYVLCWKELGLEELGLLRGVSVFE